MGNITIHDIRNFKLNRYSNIINHPTYRSIITSMSTAANHTKYGDVPQVPNNTDVPQMFVM